MKTLFLNPPFIERYDSAGARFQATRRSRSLWYPVWLAHALAVLSKTDPSGASDLLDGPAEGIAARDAVQKSSRYDCVVFYTSTPSFSNDAAIASAIKKLNEKTVIIFTGPHVSALPELSLKASSSIDAVARGEFDFTIKDIADGKAFTDIPGLTWRDGERIVANPQRPAVEDLDSLPFVSPLYKKYLPIRRYYLPFTLFPYIALYTGRGCPYRCTFCLWPQTFTGRNYRKRSITHVIDEAHYVKKELPYVREIFFDDDTFTVDNDWVSRFCDRIAPLKIRWSINARADVPPAILKDLKKAGCRLLVVGYESGDDAILNNIKKGITSGAMARFTEDCNRAGLMIHGTFVLGLPGETPATIQRSIDFAAGLKIDTLQCSIATPLPGTEFYNELSQKGYLTGRSLVTKDGFQLCPVDYPGLSHQEIEKSAVLFHKKFYNRPSYFYRLLTHIAKGPDEAYRVFSIGSEYIKYILKEGHF
ncbi:MAG: radical SAM protein [Candidatus Omnitrophica bacterium]|nr:radical SAM protein [Candidatus Omnitrophota bacterium]